MDPSPPQQTQVGAYTYLYKDHTPYIKPSTAPNVPWTVLTGPTPTATIHRILSTTRATDGPFTWRKATPASPWLLESTSFVPAQTAQHPAPTLHLVLKTQAPGEPDHWLLVVAHDTHAGHVYQVTGDAEKMRYAPAEGEAVFAAADFKTHYELAGELSPDAQAVIKHVAESEDPPCAPSRAAVRENCQGWVWRVVKKLCEKGVVQREKVVMVEGMLEPV